MTWEIENRQGSPKEKPCHILDYCPYGPLVERFPLHPEFDRPCDLNELARTGKINTGYNCTEFGHDCPVNYVAENFVDSDKDSDDEREAKDWAQAIFAEDDSAKRFNLINRAQKYPWKRVDIISEIAVLGIKARDEGNLELYTRVQDVIDQLVEEY